MNAYFPPGQQKRNPRRDVDIASTHLFGHARAGDRRGFGGSRGECGGNGGLASRLDSFRAKPFVFNGAWLCFRKK